MIGTARQIFLGGDLIERNKLGGGGYVVCEEEEMGIHSFGGGPEGKRPLR